LILSDPAHYAGMINSKYQMIEISAVIHQIKPFVDTQKLIADLNSGGD